MPTPPYAALRAAANGGTPTQGYQRVYPGDEVVLSVDPAAVAGARSIKYQLYDFPGSLGEPSGWTTTAGGIYQFSGATTAPAITLPSTYEGAFGKYPLRLLINDGDSGSEDRDHEFIDETTVLEVMAPDGLRDHAYLETAAFDTDRAAPFPMPGGVGAFKDNVRLALAAGGRGLWGLDLDPDSDVEVDVGDGNMRCHDGDHGTAQAANRTVTISDAGAVEGKLFRILRKNAAAFTLAVVNGGAGGGTPYTFGASENGDVWFRFDGTDWKRHEVWSP